MKKNLLVTLADKKYLDFAKSLFSGVYFNSGWQGDYMLLAHEVPEEDLKWFKDKGILIKKCEPLAEKLAGRWPATILSKLYLFTPEFKQWDKIIYLDADLIVCASLDKLLSVKKIGAVKHDHFTPTKLKFYFEKYGASQADYLLAQKKHNMNRHTFVSTVLAINPQIIKADTFANLSKLWQQYQNSSGGLEEIALNLFFGNLWENLPAPYCLTVDYFINHTNLKPKNLKGMVINFFVYNKPLNFFEHFYQQWKINLDRANEIDLNNRLPATKIWSQKEIWGYGLYLRIKVLIHSLDCLIGLVGIWLKKFCPAFYHFLKTLKS